MKEMYEGYKPEHAGPEETVLFETRCSFEPGELGGRVLHRGNHKRLLCDWNLEGDQGLWVNREFFNCQTVTRESVLLWADRAKRDHERRAQSMPKPRKRTGKHVETISGSPVPFLPENGFTRCSGDARAHGDLLPLHLDCPQAPGPPWRVQGAGEHRRYVAVWDPRFKVFRKTAALKSQNRSIRRSCFWVVVGSPNQNRAFLGSPQKTDFVLWFLNSAVFSFQLFFFDDFWAVPKKLKKIMAYSKTSPQYGGI